MKRFLAATAATLMLVSPLAATAASAREWHGNQRYEQHSRNDNNHHQWRRGERLSNYQRGHFRQVDWRARHLSAPPRGYHYVRDDNSGETLLVGIATGAILGVILANN